MQLLVGWRRKCCPPSGLWLPLGEKGKSWAGKIIRKGVGYAQKDTKLLTMLLFFFTVRYNDKLKQARNIGAKKGALVGASIGFVFFLFFAIDGVAFW